MARVSESGGLDDEDILALDYARLNGLSRNYLTDLSTSTIFGALQETIEDGLIDDSSLDELNLPVDCGLCERLTISKDGAQLLAWVMHLEGVESIDATVHNMMGSPEFKTTRLELPLLGSDHEFDVTEFAKRDAFESQLQDVRLPIEILDVEQNECLKFSSTLQNLGADTLDNLQRQKLIVTRESLKYIQTSIRSNWTEFDEEELLKDIQEYAKKAVLEPITPPLSPILHPIQPYEPASSDPAFHIPILSDPQSLSHCDLVALEEGMFQQDIPTPFRNTLSDHGAVCSALSIGDEFISMAEVHRSSSITENQLIRQETLKLEGPLTPPMPVPIPKSVHFSDFVEEMLLNSSSSPPSGPFSKSYIEEACGDADKTVAQQIEQETLLAADAVGRVEVPMMDFCLPEPPWKKVRDVIRPETALSMQRAIIKEATRGAPPLWLGQKHAQTKLKWNPFTHGLAKVALNETFPEDGYTSRFLLKEDDQIIDTSTLTWKPPGLKILRAGDDEEIEPGSFQNNTSRDILLLAKKRRLKLEPAKVGILGKDSTNTTEAALLSLSYSTTTPCERTFALKSDGFMSVAHPSQNEQTNPHEFGLLMGDEFSAGIALDNFLELRGAKKQKLTGSPHFTNARKQDLAQGQTAHADAKNDPAKQLSEFPSPVKSSSSLPVPEYHAPTAPISIIISSTLLKNRPLIKQIESYLPCAKLIERDFTAHNTVASLPNSVTQSPISSPLDSEADLIVSPTTGIILTTLQKLNQKTLPGHTTKPAIRDRLEKVSSKYEKLVVLVSEQRADESTNGLNENDCNSFSEFVGFTSGLVAIVLVQFVGGGERNLLKWLMNSVVHYAATEHDLLEEETHWELFLRRAGMNAFAAQSISAALKSPRGFDLQRHGQDDQSGMAAFVQMARQQRIEIFGETCGKGLLERVSSCLDARWE